MKNSNPALFSIAETLEENISRIQYGEASVSLKVHSGRIVSVTYSLTEKRKTIANEEAQKESINGGIE